MAAAGINNKIDAVLRQIEEASSLHRPAPTGHLYSSLFWTTLEKGFEIAEGCSNLCIPGYSHSSPYPYMEDQKSHGTAMSCRCSNYKAA
jgi:hypothetical protein